MKQVTAAILTQGDHIFIARRKAGSNLAGKWEFPGGKTEPGETPEQCLVREMQEEFGITVAVGGFFEESIYHYENGTIQLLAYWTKWIDGEMTPTVHDDVQWVPIEELKDYEFAPADIPFVEKLRGGSSAI
ncbi:8-oxo-dGTP diphosphatase MutT [Heliobacillus mobilis]|uniref:8-oxo-dGTP diphosphatase n=2 Tax=Heliobacterium mobile TaxID=28064 RepID=A0A6I3SDG0_HELMO|nr:8-oxo-dGTP diphosphatase MutT [Heliobacterium mobile]